MARRTNLGLLLLLVAAFVTGTLGLMTATALSRLTLIAHGVAAFALLALARPKLAVVRRGLRRHVWTRWGSLLFAVLLAASMTFGLLHSSGAVRELRGYTTLAWHIALALALIPVALWHALARRTRPRTTDLGRRSLLRAGLVVGGGAVVYTASEMTLRVAALPGAGRRFTGSYDSGSRDPQGMPVTQWLLDDVPRIDPATHVLTVRAGGAERSWSMTELARFDDAVRCVLDCTGGWFAEQEWRGAWLHRLLAGSGDARSLEVRSLTGYSRRFAVDEASRLLLATTAGGRPLDAGHGAPLRLVAPDRRGFWWVKWVSAVELSALPSWWQPPFPLR